MSEAVSASTASSATAGDTVSERRLKAVEENVARLNGDMIEQKARGSRLEEQLTRVETSSTTQFQQLLLAINGIKESITENPQARKAPKGE